ncbi:hypothetical protein GCM10010435_22570 [Winogradskya consettensis]|uniref:Uncharacterized protein n=1 Tax=Winogradskya consettensis TaxID=113560 RepID=A0A919T2V4_9ACTN|nr:hypothetical protein Aco04nite_95280 [Actinoplanes consettensis]
MQGLIGEQMCHSDSLPARACRGYGGSGDPILERRRTVGSTTYFPIGWLVPFLPGFALRAECFEVPDLPVAEPGAFTLRLQRSGVELAVPSGRSALEVVIEAGVDVLSDCEEGRGYLRAMTRLYPGGLNGTVRTVKPVAVRSRLTSCIVLVR